MKTSDYWNLLRSGRVEEGLRQLRKLQPGGSDASYIKELGVAYLWIREYENALQHFRTAIQSHPRSNTAFYGMAGVANWCLGEFDVAVDHWKTGLKADFADAAGLGIHLPMLLYVASVLRPSIFDRGAAEHLLRERVGDSRIAIWPGPIASWVSSAITEDELRVRASRANDAETRDHIWQINFYKGVMQCLAGKRIEFKESMHRAADTSGSDWQNIGAFVDRLWWEEFFIARCEVEG